METVLLLQVVEMRNIAGRKISPVFLGWIFRDHRFDHTLGQLFLGSHRAAGPAGQLGFLTGSSSSSCRRRGFTVVSLNPGHLVVVRLAFHRQNGRRRFPGRFRQLGLSSAVVIETRGTSLGRRGDFGLFGGFQLLRLLRLRRLVVVVVVAAVAAVVDEGKIGCRCLEVLDCLGVEFLPRLTPVGTVQAVAKNKTSLNMHIVSY